MGLEQRREIPFSEAAVHWYESGLPAHRGDDPRVWLAAPVPERSEADLYLWIARNQTDLAQELGLEITPENMIIGLVAQDTDASRTGVWFEGQASTRREILASISWCPSAARRSAGTRWNRRW